MIYKIIALGIVVLLLVICESLMIVAKRSDERAERMYERWNDERSNNKTE